MQALSEVPTDDPKRCLLCSPDSTIFTPHRLVAQVARDTGRRASRLPKDDGSMVVTQRDLRTSLDLYRLTRAKADFGSAAAYHFRPGLVLPDAVLSRLVECARARKIGSVADI